MKNNTMLVKGRIIKGVAGQYTVEAADGGIYSCVAKGKFRKARISPIVGDNVTVELNNEFGNCIEEISERRNKLVRPPVANIDKLIIVISAAKPFPNTTVIDKMTVLAEKNNITPVIIITKTDLTDISEIYEIYKSTGYKVYTYSDVDKSDTSEIISELKGCVCAFTGNSGVGKSTLINALSGSLQLKTGDISDKLGRGRHTTRQAELFDINGAFIIDTAGFSSIDFVDDNILLAEDLQYYFNEFNDYIGECKFTGCSHTGDKGCKICEMTENGVISKSRYESYVTMYNELKSIKKWQL